MGRWCRTRGLCPRLGLQHRRTRVRYALAGTLWQRPRAIINFVAQRCKDAQEVGLRQERRSFCRETPEQRREDLISATLEVISAGGAKAASVRNIAAQANVTMGLIRH